MSEVEHGQRGAGAASDEAPPSGWRQWFTPTGTPPAWALVRYMTCGLLLGIALSAPLPHVRGRCSAG